MKVAYDDPVRPHHNHLEEHLCRYPCNTGALIIRQDSAVYYAITTARSPHQITDSSMPALGLGQSLLPRARPGGRRSDPLGGRIPAQSLGVFEGF